VRHRLLDRVVPYHRGENYTELRFPGIFNQPTHGLSREMREGVSANELLYLVLQGRIRLGGIWERTWASDERGRKHVVEIRR
jgi:hypothetical protein